MAKKKIKIIRLFLSGAAASALCLFLERITLIKLWRFDVLSPKQWTVIGRYWANDGVISGGKQYLFFLTIFMAVPLLFFLWRLLYKADGVKLVTFPIRYVLDRQISKYENEDSHVVIKNLSSQEKLTVEDIINQRLQADNEEEHPKGAAVQNLRLKIAEKFMHKGE